MKIFYSDQFQFPLPTNHRFPLIKYQRLREVILKNHVIRENELNIPRPAESDQLLLVHSEDYLQKLESGKLSEKEIRRIGFPWSPELIERSRRSTGGTIAACRAALQEGIAVNLAGGTHHAHRDFGSGYCLLNDSAVAARVMQKEGRASRILILDCDVHQGDGTAAIFSSDPSIFTFSIHGENNFPFRKQISNLDLPLQDRTSDQEYQKELIRGLAKTIKDFHAHLVIYLAGADPYFDDRLGRLSLTKRGLMDRDRYILQTCQKEGLPVAIVMAGGYAREINDSVEIHANTVKLAANYSEMNRSQAHGI